MVDTRFFLVDTRKALGITYQLHSFDFFVVWLKNQLLPYGFSQGAAAQNSFDFELAGSISSSPVAVPFRPEIMWEMTCDEDERS